MKEIRILTKAKDMYQTYDVMIALNDKMTEIQYQDFINHWVPRGYRQFVAYTDKPIAVIALIDTPLLGVVPNKAFKIANVATIPEYRGSGISRELMTNILSHMKSEGYTIADLNCNKANLRGNAFYEKCGFNKDESFNWRMKIAGESKEIRAKL